MKLRKANQSDADIIWEILQDAIEKRKQDGSNQWQDGYPNPTVIAKDIQQAQGYVLEHTNQIVGYCAIILNNEPAYQAIVGQWISEQDFLVVHRVAIAKAYLGQHLAQKIMLLIEDIAIQQEVFSIKVDTNFDNHAMLHILQKLGYTYCGEVFFRGSPRKAFEKLLKAK